MTKKLLSFLILCASLALAQSNSGTLTGKITDNSGAGVPNAPVTVTEVSTGASQRVLTAPDGSFTISNLPAGTYRVETEVAGFRRSSISNIELLAGKPSRVDVVLEAGAVTMESVEVKGMSPVVQAESGEVSRGYSTGIIRALPVKDRNHEQLVGLMPGVTPPQPAL